MSEYMARLHRYGHEISDLRRTRLHRAPTVPSSYAYGYMAACAYVDVQSRFEYPDCLFLTGSMAFLVYTWYCYTATNTNTKYLP